MNLPSPGLPLGWTTERVNELKRLRLEEGLSCSQIAKQLGGITRNAVIGKLHRLGLAVPGKPSAPKRYKPSAPRLPKAVREPKPPEFERVEQKFSRGVTSVGVDSMGRKFFRVPSAAPPRVRLFVAETPPVGIMEIGARVCRYPMNDGEDPVHGWLFCGADVAPVGPYCPNHKAIAWDTAATERANIKATSGKSRRRNRRREANAAA